MTTTLTHSDLWNLIDRFESVLEKHEVEASGRGMVLVNGYKDRVREMDICDGVMVRIHQTAYSDDCHIELRLGKASLLCSSPEVVGDLVAGYSKGELKLGIVSFT